MKRFVLFAQAAATLVVTGMTLRLAPRLASRNAARLARKSADHSTAPVDPAIVESVARAVSAANRRLPRPASCLTVAIATHRLLKSKGVGSALRIGVRGAETGSEALLAHAWVECGGRVIAGEINGLAEYAPLGSRR